MSQPRLTVQAGVYIQPDQDIYELHESAGRAMRLYDLGRREGYETEQLFDEEEQIARVVVTGPAYTLLAYLRDIVEDEESPASPYAAELRRSLQTWPFENEGTEEHVDPLERAVDQIWGWHGSTIYALDIVEDQEESEILGEG